MADLDDDAIKALKDLGSVSDAYSADKIVAELFEQLLKHLPNLKEPKRSTMFMSNMMAAAIGLSKPFKATDYQDLGESRG